MNKAATFDLGRMRLSGNQAVARGALEAGVRMTSAYPGAPISDLQGSFEQLAGNLPKGNPFTIRVGEALGQAGYQLAAHWGTTSNEDNAAALALGAVIGKADFKKREFLTEEEWDLVYGETVFAKDEDKRIPVGSRVLCSFKHLGGNTAADALRDRCGRSFRLWTVSSHPSRIRPTMSYPVQNRRVHTLRQSARHPTRPAAPAASR